MDEVILFINDVQLADTVWWCHITSPIFSPAPLPSSYTQLAHWKATTSRSYFNLLDAKVRY